MMRVDETDQLHAHGRAQDFSHYQVYSRRASPSLSTTKPTGRAGCWGLGDANLPLALDAIGGTACLHLAQSLSMGGTVVNYGFLSGDPCMITPTETVVRDITLRGFWLANHLSKATRQAIEAIFTEVTSLIMDGTISAPVEATYGLDEVKTALAHAGRGERSGKILFTPGGPIA